MPQFHIVRRFLPVLEELGFPASACAAVTPMFLRVGDPRESRGFEFHLDTKADVSMIPAAWFEGEAHLLGPLSRLIRINTPAGPASASGRMARQVEVAFPGDPASYWFDFFVCEHLSDRFGLLSLRDLLRCFPLVRTQGPFTFTPDGDPVVLGYLEANPR